MVFISYTVYSAICCGLKHASLYQIYFILSLKLITQLGIFSARLECVYLFISYYKW